MPKGYILLHRQVQDNWLWLSEPFTKSQAWIDLLLLASHSGNIFFIRGNKIELKTGEIGYSKEQLATRWKWSRKKVLTFLKMLEKEQQITQHKTPSIVIIRVDNYEKYQKREQQNEQQKNNRRTTEEHKQLIINNDKEKKNIKKKSKKEITDNQLTQFETFWTAYGYKKSRPAALASFLKALEVTSFDRIIDSATKYTNTRGEISKYWKHPTTWLNQGCWDDEYKAGDSSSVKTDDDIKRQQIREFYKQQEE